MLRRVRELGGSTQDLLDVFVLQIRSLTEIACPVWNGSITKKNSDTLERLQKTAMKIIFGHTYKSYQKSLNLLGLKTLEERRKDVCLKFAKNASISKKYQAWFASINRQTRSNTQYSIPKARTTSYENSPLMYLTYLLNQ